MGLLSEKYNYVKGLCDGLEISNETKEGKVILALMELLDDVVLSVEDLEDSRDEMNEFLDEIDEDLADLEEAVYEEDDDCDCDCDCDCDEDGIIAEVECPECNALIELSADMLNDECTSFICPNCEEEIEVDWECDCDCEDDDCDCCDCE